MKAYLEYKDSGVRWIGGIPKHWEMRKISRSFKLIGSGSTPKSDNDSYFNDGNINWVNTGDLNDGFLSVTSKLVNDSALKNYSSLKLYPKGTLLIAMYGATIGKISIIDFEGCTNQACCAISQSPYINNLFAFYWFLANRNHIINLSEGGGQPNISQEIIKSLKISSPSVDEQSIIISYLNHKTQLIDTLIEKKQKQIELLQEQRTAITNQAVTKGLDPNVKMKDSGSEWLGEIPEHWRISNIGYEVQAGRLEHQDGNHGELHPRADDYVDEGIPFIMANNVNCNLDLKNSKKIPRDIADNLRIGFSIEGDVLLTHKGTIGRTAIVGEIETDYIMLTPQVTYYRCLESIENKFLKYFFDSDFFQTQLKVIASKGSTRHYIGLISQREAILCLPDKNEQRTISNWLDSKVIPINKYITEINQEIKLLYEYRTTLISDVVTGKIDVRDEVIPS